MNDFCFEEDSHEKTTDLTGLKLERRKHESAVALAGWSIDIRCIIK